MTGAEQPQSSDNISINRFTFPLAGRRRLTRLSLLGTRTEAKFNSCQLNFLFHASSFLCYLRHLSSLILRFVSEITILAARVSIITRLWSFTTILFYLIAFFSVAALSQRFQYTHMFLCQFIGGSQLLRSHSVSVSFSFGAWIMKPRCSDVRRI